jgi:hypothetical protein
MQFTSARIGLRSFQHLCLNEALNVRPTYRVKWVLFNQHVFAPLSKQESTRSISLHPTQRQIEKTSRLSSAYHAAPIQ